MQAHVQAFISTILKKMLTTSSNRSMIRSASLTLSSSKICCSLHEIVSTIYVYYYIKAYDKHLPHFLHRNICTSDWSLWCLTKYRVTSWSQHISAIKYYTFTFILLSCVYSDTILNVRFSCSCSLLKVISSYPFSEFRNVLGLRV